MNGNGVSEDKAKDEWRKMDFGLLRKKQFQKLDGELEIIDKQ